MTGEGHMRGRKNKVGGGVGGEGGDVCVGERTYGG